MLHSVRFACSNDGSASWPGTAVFSCTAMRAKKTSFQCTRTTLKTAKSSATAVPSATGVSSATDWGCSTFYFAFLLFLRFLVQHSAAWNFELPGWFVLRFVGWSSIRYAASPIIRVSRCVSSYGQ